MTGTFGNLIWKALLLIIVGLIGFYIINALRAPVAVIIIFIILYSILWPVVFGGKGAIVTIIILGLMLTLVIMADPTKTENVFTKTKLGMGDVWEWFGEQWDKIIKGYERTQAGLTGDYYEGEVQKASQKNLGVFIDEFRSISTRFEEGEKILLYSQIRAETMEDKEITIKVNCELDGKIPDEIIPYNTFITQGYAKENIDFVFENENNKYPPGNYRAKMSAGFDFETNSFIKAYFMDLEKKREMITQNIDIEEQFGMEKYPTAIYSAGPIMIGMNLGEMPIGIKEDQAYGPTIAMTIENIWNGKIKKLNNLTITTPGEISQTDLNGEKPTNCIGCEKGSEECICKYDLSKEDMSSKNIISLRIHTQINDANTLIGIDPVSFKSIRANINYDYAIQEEMGLTITQKRTTK